MQHTLSHVVSGYLRALLELKWVCFVANMGYDSEYAQFGWRLVTDQHSIDSCPSLTLLYLITYLLVVLEHIVT